LTGRIGKRTMRRAEAQEIAERVMSGPHLAAARRRRLDRTAALRPRPAADRPRPDSRCRVPANTPNLRIVSRRWVPMQMRADEGDARLLGVALAWFQLDRNPIDLAGPLLSARWMRPKPNGGGPTAAVHSPCAAAACWNLAWR